MNSFIIAMIVVVMNGTPQYWYNINESNPHTTSFSCETKIADNTFQQQALQGFNRIFRNKVVMVRLACIDEDKVSAYKVFMKEKNDANVANMNGDN